MVFMVLYADVALASAFAIDRRDRRDIDRDRPIDAIDRPIDAIDRPIDRPTGRKARSTGVHSSIARVRDDGERVRRARKRRTMRAGVERIRKGSFTATHMTRRARVRGE